MNWQRWASIFFTNSTFASLLLDDFGACFKPSFASIGFWSAGPKRRIFARFILGPPSIPAILRTKAIETFMPFCDIWRALIRSRAIPTNQFNVWHQSYSSMLAWFKRTAISFWRWPKSIKSYCVFSALTFTATKTPSFHQAARDIKRLSTGLTDLIRTGFGAHRSTYDILRPSFSGSGTTGKVALELGRSAILIELNPAYVEMARARTNVTAGFF